MWLRGRRRPGADCLEIVLEALSSVCVLHKRNCSCTTVGIHFVYVQVRLLNTICTQ